MARTIPQGSRDYDTTRVVERPDGFYWHDEKEGDRAFGPFPTLLEAIQDMEYNETRTMNREKPWSKPRTRLAYPTGSILKPVNPAKDPSGSKTDQHIIALARLIALCPGDLTCCSSE